MKYKWLCFIVVLFVLIIVLVLNFKKDPEVETKFESYEEIKEELVIKAKLYVEEEYQDIDLPDSINVTFDLMYANGMIDRIVDINDSSIICDGYVIVTNDNTDLHYEPYLWCQDNYKDDGYISYLES